MELWEADLLLPSHLLVTVRGKAQGRQHLIETRDTSHEIIKSLTVEDGFFARRGEACCDLH